jgi:hypothetical protein
MILESNMAGVVARRLFVPAGRMSAVQREEPVDVSRRTRGDRLQTDLQSRGGADVSVGNAADA